MNFVFGMFKAFLFVMIPLVAESMRSEANNSSNLAWYGISGALLVARNLIYLSIVLTFIGWYCQTTWPYVLASLLALLGANGFRNYLPYVYYALLNNKN